MAGVTLIQFSGFIIEILHCIIENIIQLILFVISRNSINYPFSAKNNFDNLIVSKNTLTSCITILIKNKK